MGLFERFLSLWIALAIVAGVAIGALVPSLPDTLSSLELAGINLPIALLIWGMIYPMMLAVDFSAIGGLSRQPRGLLITVVVNWLINSPAGAPWATPASRPVRSTPSMAT